MLLMLMFLNLNKPITCKLVLHGEQTDTCEILAALPTQFHTKTLEKN